jgi:uncharacterized coiled-coil DUF342 family protein
MRACGLTGGHGSSTLTFGLQRDALEETVGKIRAAIAEWNESVPALLAEYEVYAAERKTADDAKQERLAEVQAEIDRLMAT